MTSHQNSDQFVAFARGRRIAVGVLDQVALQVAKAIEGDTSAEDVQVFHARSSKPVDLDLRGTPDEIASRYTQTEEPELPRGRGRPKLGVVGKEVTLLPRHWAWLAEQPGGASVALRKLVDQARKQVSTDDVARASQKAAYEFMYAIGGNLEGFEEAIRALYNRDERRFAFEIDTWPNDIKQHALALAKPSFE
jgi:hypothetical protein